MHTILELVIKGLSTSHKCLDVGLQWGCTLLRESVAIVVVFIQKAEKKTFAVLSKFGPKKVYEQHMATGHFLTIIPAPVYEWTMPI